MLKLRLKDPSLLVDRAYVGGEWISADNGETLSVTDPATGLELGRIPALGPTETSRAVESASAAWKGWREVTPAERARLLENSLHRRS